MSRSPRCGDPGRRDWGLRGKFQAHALDQQRQFGLGLRVAGEEVFARTADSVGAGAASGLNIRGTYQLRAAALRFSTGRGIVNAASTNQAS
jgi:hypothetical protein